MARGGSRGRRSYVRDGNGRFASTPGGGASRKAKPSPGFRRSQQVKLAKQRGQTGRLGSATKEARARLKASKAKLTPGASRQQRAAVTRAQRTVAALSGRRRIAGARPAGVLRGPAAGKVRKASGARVRDVRGDGMSRGRPGQLARAAARAEANLQRLAGPAMRQQTKSGRSRPETGYAVSQAAADLYSGKARSTGRALNRLPVSLSFDRGKKVAARRMSDARIGAKGSGGSSKRKGVTGSGGSRKAGPEVVTATPMGSRRVPAAQRPGSITSTLRSTLQALAKADAARIREVEAITGMPIRAPRKPPSGQGATVRAPGPGSIAGTLRDNLRSLAQSDARYIRELDALTRPGASGALPGSSGGRRRVSGGKSGAKALPPAPAPEPKPKPAPRSRKKAEGPASTPAPKRVVYRTRAQAARAQRERNRRLVEFGRSAPGGKGMGGGRSMRRRSVRVPQGNLLTGRVEMATVRTRTTFGPSRIGESAAAKRTARRRARAEARYEALLQERKAIMGKGRVRNDELARNSQRMGAVGGAFRVYDMGTGRRPPRRRTGRRVRNSGDRN